MLRQLGHLDPYHAYFVLGYPLLTAVHQQISGAFTFPNHFSSARVGTYAHLPKHCITGSPPAASGEPCPQPDNWCDGSGEVLARSDCGDGDGVDDWTCIQPDTSRRAVLLSSSNCTLDYWSDAAKSLCPPRFNGASQQPTAVACRAGCMAFAV